MTFQKAGKCVFAVRTLNTRDNVLAGVLLDCKKKTTTQILAFSNFDPSKFKIGTCARVAKRCSLRLSVSAERPGTRRWGLHSQTEWGAARGAYRAHSCDHWGVVTCTLLAATLSSTALEIMHHATRLSTVTPVCRKPNRKLKKYNCQQSI